MHVLRVGFEFGGGGGQFTAAVASLIEQQAAVAEKFVDFGETGAELFVLKLQEAFAGLCCVSFGSEIAGRLCQLLVFCFTLKFFGGSRFDL